jgi:P27 family predicted phage terminase small subunit
MGLRGPAQTPTSLKILRGNPGCRPLNLNEFKPTKPPEIPDPPPYLTGFALEEFNRLAPEIYSVGLLTNVDVTMFSCYCVAYHLWRDAVAAHRKAMQGKDIDLQCMLARLVIQCSQDLLRLAQNFGFTPSARTRISVVPPIAPSKFGNLLGGPPRDFKVVDPD